jgi:ankyrin repeat protein
MQDQGEVSGTLQDGMLVAARTGDVRALAALLDEHPDMLNLRTRPYEWTLLHVAAAEGRLQAMDLLLRRGLDVNARDTGDNSYAMHWAAAAGHLDVVRRLADAGGDVVGRDDDHGLEVIGWATCFDVCQDAVAEFLVSRGASHHIFSAISMNLADEVRRIVAADPGALSSRMSRNEDHRLPLQLAVRKNRPDMVSLLLELGADPLGADGSGHTAAAYATSPQIDLLAAAHGHDEVVRALMDAGADPRIRDSKHDGDPIDWAEHFERPAIVRILRPTA